ncbi:hypothetical protein [Thalassoglobus polymorphus]|uniref:Uncharacterized protein n=1 Tax=Thalassoglobus polymorphus TaxID=2527994 RepID=A0A517QQD1_9PLAN|nr:hypothetical protein [Thalassoglobus polymorphus]QDT33831.1 hypothetical protein Mal48_30870 [Thalassoglobus polymorphus]
MKTNQPHLAIGFCHFNAGDLNKPESVSRLARLVRRASKLESFSSFRMVLFIEDGQYHHLARWVDSNEQALSQEIQNQLQASRIQLNSVLAKTAATGVTLLHAADLIPFFTGMKEKHQTQFTGRYYEFAAGQREPCGYTGPKLIRDLLALSHPDTPVYNLDQDVLEDARDLERTAFLVTQLANKAKANLHQPFAVSGAYTDERVYDKASIRVLQYMLVPDAIAILKNESAENSIVSEPDLASEPIDEYFEYRSAQRISNTLDAMVENVMPHVKDQLLSGACFIPNALFLKQHPEVSNLRGLASWSDDHWLEAIRRGTISDEAKADLGIRFEQQRHPDGATFQDVQWHARQFLPRLFFGIAGLDMLKDAKLKETIQNGLPNSPELRDAIWKEGRKSLMELVSPETSQYYAGTVMAAAVDGLPNAEELGFLNEDLYPTGLRNAITELPESYPGPDRDKKNLEGEFQRLVEDIAVWATDMRIWWSDCFIPVAESFQLPGDSDCV